MLLYMDLMVWFSFLLAAIDTTGELRIASPRLLSLILNTV